MTYRTVYSSEATIPMQSDDLEELLQQARTKNARAGISGALVYTDGMFLQILEGERAAVQDLMARIVKDVRHEKVTVLREGEIESPQFASWKMAYVAATPEQMATWAGMRKEAGSADDLGDLRRTTQFAHDILALLAADPAAVDPHRESVAHRPA